MLIDICLFDKIEKNLGGSMKRIFILMLLVNSIFYSKEITKFMKENERTIIQIYDVREELQLSSEKI